MMSLASVSMPSPASGVDTANSPGGALDTAMTDAVTGFGTLLTRSMASACPDGVQQGQPTREPTPQDEESSREDPAAAVQNLLMLLPASPAPATELVQPQSAAKPDADSVALKNDATPREVRTEFSPAQMHEPVRLEKSARHSGEDSTSFRKEAGRAEQAPAEGAIPSVGITTQTSPSASLVDTSSRLQSSVLPLRAPLGSSGWNREFSHQVSWMSRNDLHSASLSLNPPELGPVRVELQLTGTETTATFSSAVPEVRQAIEAAMPELKALMEASGLHLTNTRVDHGSHHLLAGGDRDRQARRHATTRNDHPSGSDSVEVTDTSAVTRALHPQLLDLYA